MTEMASNFKKDLEEIWDKNAQAEQNRVQKLIPQRLPRVWKCGLCGAMLIAELDMDTFIRIPSFTNCPICIEGLLNKVREHYG
jgi:rubrerythrin